MSKDKMNEIRLDKIRVKPLEHSGPLMASATMPATTSSPTSLPESMIVFALRPISVPAFTASLNMSPVDRCCSIIIVIISEMIFIGNIR